MFLKISSLTSSVKLVLIITRKVLNDSRIAFNFETSFRSIFPSKAEILGVAVASLPARLHLSRNRRLHPDLIKVI